MRTTIGHVLVAAWLCACGSEAASAPAAGVAAGSSDAGSSDAGSSDAGSSDTGSSDTGSDAGTPETRDLFVFVGMDFYVLDAETAAGTLVGKTGIGPMTRATYMPSTSTLLAVYDNPGAPKLASVDVCTGVATHLVNLALPGNFIDGIDVDPSSGLVYATVSANGNHPADGFAEHLVRIDVSTGMTTSLGSLGVIADADHLLLAHGSPLVGSNDSTSGQLVLYDFNLTTRVASSPRSGIPRAVRLAAHRGAILGAGVDGAIAGQLVRVDPATATASAIGALPAATVGPLVSAQRCDR